MTEKFNFEKFENRNARLVDKISVTKSFSIGFPTKFYKDNRIDKYQYVVLYYDKDKKAVGIQFTNDAGEPNRFSVTHSKQGYGGSVVARSFFGTYNIDPKKYHGRYEWEKHRIEGAGEVFVIALKEREKEAKKDI